MLATIVLAIGDELLTVPANALVRTDTGQYWVEVVTPGNGGTRFVPVEIGRTSGVTVEVIGDIAEGDTVISP